MALTKVEAAKLTNDVFMRGVIEILITDSEILRHLPFESVVGSAFVYNRELVAPTVAFFAVGDTWTENVGTHTQVSQALSILGGDADVDGFLQQTYADPNDQRAVVIAEKTKALAYKFNATFCTGDTAVDANSFMGLKKLVGATAQEITMGANGAALTLDKMDELIDLVKPGRPDAIVVAKRVRRKLSSLRRASSNLLETGVDDFGKRALFYDGIPLLVDDNLPITEVEGTSGAVCATAYAIKWGRQGLMGFENGGIQVEDVGALETKDASRSRVKWYVSLGMMGTLGLAGLRGINNT